MNYALGVEVQPLLATITIVTIITYIFTYLINREKCSNWIASKFLGDKNSIKKLSVLSKERRQIELERNSISAQDQYAKWTKLNRKLNKLNDEITGLSEKISSEQSKHINTISRLIMIVQNAPMYFVKFWYARTPVLLFIQNTPYSWKIPFPLSYLMRMPMGQRNSVSALFWCMAVEGVLSVIHTFGVDFYKHFCNTEPIVAEAKAPTEEKI